MPARPEHDGAVAVTGVGLLSCLGRGFEAHQRALAGSSSGLGVARLVPALAGTVVGEIDDGLLEPLRVAEPRVVRLGRVAALEALEGSALLGRGVFVVGTTTGSIFESEQHFARALAGGGEPLWRMRHHPVGELAVTLAASLGLDAECHTFVTACSSSSNAIGYGALRVAAGAPWALVGGVDTMCLMTYAGFHALRLLSRGPPRPFDVKRTGVAVAEGAAFLLLEPRHLAERRGARVFGEVTGWGCAVDAFHQTAPDPAGLGALAAMRAALEDDGGQSADVGYVNAHGTATPANDRVEAIALAALFGSARPYVSSTKGFTGHTLGAAGALEAGLCLAAFDAGRVPPSLGLVDRDPACDVHHVPAGGAALPSSLALSNSFGFGGNNATLALRSPGSRSASPARRIERPTGPVFVHGLGFVAPGAVGLTALGARLRLPPGPFSGALELQEGGDKRLARLARLERIAIHAAKQALGDIRPEGVALIVGTAYGRLDAAGDFLKGVHQRGIEHGSPFAFYQSVYHSLAGQLGIHLGMRGIGLTTSAREVSSETALRVGLDLLAAGKAERVLVVAADDAAVALRDLLPPEHPVRLAHPEGDVCGAAAVLLSLEPSRDAVVFCELRRHAADGDGLAAGAQTAALLEQAFAIAGREALGSAALGEPLGLRELAGDPVRFGLQAASGLMRVVAAFDRLEPGRGAVIHGLGLGGLQAATVVRRG